MKHILIPTDFSEVAAFAEQAALSLATRIGAEAVFLTCLPGEQHDTFTEITQDNIPLKLADAYRAFQARRKPSDPPFRVMLSQDKLKDAVKQFTSSYDTDLVIMGSSGTYGWKQLWGSNAQMVTRIVDCPVLIVKQAMEQIAFRDILFASNFRKEAQASFQRLVGFAELFGARIHLAYVTTIETDRVETYLANQKMNTFKELAGNLPVTMQMLGDVNAQLGIEHFANEKEIDLVAMVSHQDGFFKKLFRGGSVSETLVNRLEKPILVLPVEQVAV